MGKERGFENLWHLALTKGKSRNDVAYHSCCDVWTTRGAEKARASHVKITRWRELMADLGYSREEDKKTLLLAKMVEEQWALPAVINRPCRLAIVSTQKRGPKKVECGLPFKSIHEEVECYGESFGHQAGDENLEREVEKTFTLPVQSQVGLDR